MILQAAASLNLSSRETNEGRLDPLSKEKRSALMRKVRQKNTAPELLLRRLLHAKGWRYRLHSKDLPGRPDIVFRGKRLAIFVHGCFWHGHLGCNKATVPKTRTDFWLAKIEANRARDLKAEEALKELGWRVAVVWQCELREPDKVLARLERMLASDGDGLLGIHLVLTCGGVNRCACSSAKRLGE
ncbi:MAG TPA: very short patch repair endonuclease [Microvirga sp.]